MPYQFTQTGAEIQALLDYVESIVPVNLFSGDSTSDVPLSQSAANYSMLEIFYEGYNTANPQSIRILNPNGRRVTLSVVETGGSPSQTRVRYSTYNISGTSITITDANSGYVMIANTGNTHTMGSGVIHVTRVDGYV